tara:strand:+ start:182 stop:925 length:744 start_codon:yes stop_codon:yes gene_type:complete
MKINIFNNIKNFIFFSLSSDRTYNNVSTIQPIKYFSFRKVRDYLITNEYNQDIYSTKKNDISFICKTIVKNKEQKKLKLAKKQNKNKNKYGLTAEHIYPQSLTKQYKSAKHDAHNIYLTLQTHNSYRNNYKYVDEIYFTYSYKNSLYFENNLKYDCTRNYKNTRLRYYIPIHTSRGKIARTLAYMKIKYPRLLLSDVIDKATLIEWNFKYPPDKFEKYKNILCYKLQGNTNIFIDDYYLLNNYIDVL